MRVDLAAGMELGLICELEPAWNVDGRERGRRFGAIGGRMGQQLLKMWIYSPLFDQLSELARRNGRPIDNEATEAIMKHVRENRLPTPPKKDPNPQEFREPT